MRLQALSGRPEQALVQYESLRDALQSGLGIRPTEATRRLRDEIAAGRLSSKPLAGPAQPVPSDGAKHNLTAPVTSFVGRARELRAVKRELVITRLRYENNLNTARSHLGERAYEKAWTEGKATDQQLAIEYAFSEEELVISIASPPSEITPADEQPHGLTRREREVVALVARGLTNRQVSTQLGISDRTAANHVARILRKLGLSSRAQVASWAAQRQPLAPDQV